MHMEKQVTTDLRKVLIWDNVCKELNWAREGELEHWLSHNKVAFTEAGSAVPLLHIYNLSDTRQMVKLIVKSSPQLFATLVLQVLTGLVMLNSSEQEQYFWRLIEERIENEFRTKIPREILPSRFQFKNLEHDE
jgi:hypothetical protein